MTKTVLMPQYRSKKMTCSQGFTLVEAIVAGMIAVIIGSITLIVFQMANQMVECGGISTKIQMQYSIVVMQIGKSIRGANVVIENQTWPPASNAAATTTQVIYLFNSSGLQTGGYQVNGTVLQELVAGSWQNFRVGPSNVLVTAASNFSLSGDKKWITLGLNVFSTFKSLKDTVTSKQEAFTCRN